MVRFDCIVPTVCMTERILFTVGSVDRSIGRNSGRHSVDSRSIVSRDSINIAVNSQSRLGRQSDNTRSRHGRQSFQMCLGRYSFSFTDTSPTLHRQFVNSSLMYRSVIGQHSVDGWSTLGRQSEDSKNTLKNSCGDDGMVSLTPMAVQVD